MSNLVQFIPLLSIIGIIVLVARAMRGKGRQSGQPTSGGFANSFETDEEEKRK